MVTVQTATDWRRVTPLDPPSLGTVQRGHRAPLSTALRRPRPADGETSAGRESVSPFERSPTRSFPLLRLPASARPPTPPRRRRRRDGDHHSHRRISGGRPAGEERVDPAARDRPPARDGCDEPPRSGALGQKTSSGRPHPSAQDDDDHPLMTGTCWAKSTRPSASSRSNVLGRWAVEAGAGGPAVTPGCRLGGSLDAAHHLSRTASTAATR